MYLIVFIPYGKPAWLAEGYASRDEYLASADFPSNYSWEERSAREWRVIHDNEPPAQLARLFDEGADPVIEVIANGRLEYYAHWDQTCPPRAECLWNALCRIHHGVYELTNYDEAAACLAAVKAARPALWPRVAVLLDKIFSKDRRFNNLCGITDTAFKCRLI